MVNSKYLFTDKKYLDPQNGQYGILHSGLRNQSRLYSPESLGRILGAQGGNTLGNTLLHPHTGTMYVVVSVLINYVFCFAYVHHYENRNNNDFSPFIGDRGYIHINIIVT